jgi:hypothetical protein
VTTELTEAEVDFETAVGDPAAYYSGPEGIVDDPTLSKAQKLRFLGEWAQDLAARQTADGEGMAAEDASVAARDAALIKQVKAALEQVEAQPDQEASSTFRTLWARLKRLAD